MAYDSHPLLSTRSLWTLAAIPFVSVVAPAISWADIIGYYNSPTSFSVSITGMPDLDQCRILLPMDGSGRSGGMYCVPTANANLFAYAANHGFPELVPGPGNWQAQSNFTTGTYTIAAVGFQMDTDPILGTSSGAFSGATEFVATYVEKDRLCVQYVYSYYPDTWLRLHDIAQQVALGGIASMAYGRYTITGVTSGVYTLDINASGALKRSGGHAMTFESAAPSAPFADFFLHTRDPAKPDSADASQSVFESTTTDVFALTLQESGERSTFTADTMYWDPSSTSGTVRLIDAAQVLRPCGALRFSNGGGIYSLTQLVPWSFGRVPPAVTLTGSVFGMEDLAYSADSREAYALVNTSPTSGATQLRRINLASGQQQVVGSSSSLRGVVVGRDGRVYAHDGTSIFAYKADGTPAAAPVTPIGAPSAIAYDDLRDRVVVLSVARRSVTAFNKALAPIAEVVIPAAIRVAGQGSVAVSPEDGTVFFVTSGNNSLGAVGPGMAAAEVSLSAVAGVTAPQRVACGDAGRVWITSQGFVRALTREDGGHWMQDPSSPFHLMLDQGPLAIMRSRTNFDPARHTGPGWNNVDPTEEVGLGTPIADCVADLNDDGHVDGADLAVLLDNWGDHPELNAVTISFDYVARGAGSWASDLALVIDDGVHPTVGWGGYDSVLGAAIDAGNWPFYGAGSAASGHYSATVPLPAGAVLSGGGSWSATVGNGWAGSPTVQYKNVRVEPAGIAMPSLVFVGDQTSAGLQSTNRPFATTVIAGDINSDGVVDGADLGAFLNAWGACPG